MSLAKRLAALKAKHEEETRLLETEMWREQGQGQGQEEPTDKDEGTAQVNCCELTISDIKLPIGQSQQSSYTLSQQSHQTARPTTSRKHPAAQDSSDEDAPRSTPRHKRPNISVDPVSPSVTNRPG